MYNNRHPFADIVAVTNRSLSSRPFEIQLTRICEVRPKAVILREKDMPEEAYLLLAQNTIALCRKYSIPCILHSFISIAKQLEHPYIHLPLPLLREHADELSGFTRIGTSVHSVSDALEAAHLGATYLTAGHIYATDCKKGLPPRGLSFLQDVCSHVSIPVYAIGGIHLAKACGHGSTDPGSAFRCPQLDEVMAHGASGACIMSGMMHL